MLSTSASLVETQPTASYAVAYRLWHDALALYLRLAREGAPAAKLRAAAAAVHSAALEKGRLARALEAAEH
jgi:hypothetical protein